MKIIDLSQEISANTLVYPGDHTADISPVLSLNNGDNCNLSKLSLGSHTATHCDAFSHFIIGGTAADKLPLEHFYGNAAVVDIEIRNGLIDTDELINSVLQLESVKIIILRTGFEKNAGTPEYFTQMPKFTKTFGEFLKSRGIITLGVDFPSAESVNGAKEMHIDLLSNSVAIVEGLVNLNEITEKYFTFCGMPLKLKNCDGSPIRAAAVI